MKSSKKLDHLRARRIVSQTVLTILRENWCGCII